MTEKNGVLKIKGFERKCTFCCKSAELWHKRLGHLKYRSIITTTKNSSTKMGVLTKSEVSQCESCIKVRFFQ